MYVILFLLYIVVKIAQLNAKHMSHTSEIVKMHTISTAQLTYSYLSVTKVNFNLAIFEREDLATCTSILL